MDDNTFDAKRRNLLAITVVLCFLKFADASVSSTATVSALSITVKRPEAIFDFLWLLWAYFFLRAYQHFHYHLKLPYKKSIQKTLVPILHPYAARSGAPDEFERELHEDLERFYKYDLRFNPRAFSKILLWSMRHPLAALVPMLASPVQVTHRRHLNLIRYPTHTTGLRRLTAQSVYAWTIVLWTIVTPPLEAPSKMKVRLLDSFGLRFWLGFWVSLRMTLALTLRSTPFFDYRLPFLIALAPVPYYLLVK